MNDELFYIKDCDGYPIHISRLKKGTVVCCPRNHDMYSFGHLLEFTVNALDELLMVVKFAGLKEARTAVHPNNLRFLISE